MKKSEFIKRGVCFVLGLFILALGVSFGRLAELGVAPVSSVANVLSIKLTFMSFGTWFMLWNIGLALVHIFLLRRDFTPAMLLPIPMAVVFGWFTDLTMLCIGFITPGGYASRMALVLLGVVCIALGVSLTVIADVTMNAPEAFVKAIAIRLNKNFGDMKVAFDVSSVAAAVILSLLLFDLTVVGTREGTVITACCTGFAVKAFTRLLKAPLNRVLAVTKQRQ